MFFLSESVIQRSYYEYSNIKQYVRCCFNKQLILLFILMAESKNFQHF